MKNSHNNWYIKWGQISPRFDEQRDRPLMEKLSPESCRWRDNRKREVMTSPCSGTRIAARLAAVKTRPLMGSVV